MDRLSTILNYLSTSYSPYHVIENVKTKLDKEGFIRLSEKESYNLEPNKKYYVIRNGTSLIAFKVPSKIENPSLHITASHSDSPTFKLKPNPLIVSQNNMSLNVEPYGGAIYASWLDRPLSFAGRIMVKEGDNIRSQLCNIDRDLLIIPHLAIHLNRQVNSGFAYNPSKEMIPLFGLYIEGFEFTSFLKKELGLNEEACILSHDLFLYNRTKPTLLGANNEFLASPREDDLASLYTSLEGFIDSESNENVIPMFVAFDNEEVGSLTRQGAHSTFLRETVHRLSKVLSLDEERMIAASYLLSIDNAHASHPSYPEVNDKNVNIQLNGGIVIKYNANQSYTSDGYSASLIKALCMKDNLSYQEFTNRSDMRGGSTLGNISNSEISFVSCDIGIAQLSMHASYETLGKEDLLDMITLTKSYFETPFELEDSRIKI